MPVAERKGMKEQNGRERERGRGGNEVDDDEHFYSYFST